MNVPPSPSSFTGAKDWPSPALLFASDLHVGGDHPDRTAACKRLLRLCRDAPAVAGLYLLGDIFDLWLGDDDDREPHRDIERALRAVVDGGTPVCVQRGNHDLLLGSEFVARTGVTLLPDEHCLLLGERRVLLMHGDLLCSDDVEYLAFRASAHETKAQAQFLSLPLAQRVAVAADLRQRSRSHTSASASDIMDVTQHAVLAALARHQASILIHGHTHRPAKHAISTTQGPGTRYVLADWHRPPSVLAHAGGEFVSLELDALAMRLDTNAPTESDESRRA